MQAAAPALSLQSISRCCVALVSRSAGVYGPEVVQHLRFRTLPGSKSTQNLSTCPLKDALKASPTRPPRADLAPHHMKLATLLPHFRKGHNSISMPTSQGLGLPTGPLEAIASAPRVTSENQASGASEPPHRWSRSPRFILSRTRSGRRHRRLLRSAQQA